MGKLSNKQGEELVKAGVITQEALEKMQESGQVGTTRGNKAPRVFEGTEISPQIYFKGAKGVNKTKDMLACRNEIDEVIEKYTVLAI